MRNQQKFFEIPIILKLNVFIEGPVLGGRLCQERLVLGPMMHKGTVTALN